MDSLFGISKDIIEHGLNTSPTEGNGYGVALGFSLFINLVLALAYVWQERSKRQLAKDYVGFLEEAHATAEKRANSERKRNGSGGA